ncbi:MAG TPA: mannosyltransferase family protein [Candidatus Acidoferrum sp.]|nr:mannosyltransferase family protein [Candidatus Acidoferrum sp.]
MLPKQDWIVVGWVIAIKLLLFFVVVKSYPMLWDRYEPHPDNWLQIWDQWDFGYYREIAEFGYSGGDGSIAFYPLFPWLMRLVAYITRSYLIAGLFISGIASVVAAIALRRLVQFDYAASVAMRSVWFFLIFPTAYFLHVPYSESLFIGLALTCFICAHSERWWLAGLLGALCWMTRGVGVVLVPALAAEAMQQYYARRRWNWQWCWVAIVPAGFAVYLLINWHITGNPFAFLQARKVSFNQSFAFPSVGIRLAIWAQYPTPREAEMGGIEELIFVALGFVCMIISWIKLRPVYAVWMTAMWFLATSVSFLQSVPRYTLTMFPIFVLFGLLGRNRFWAGFITVWSLLFFTLFAVLFARGEWAF